MTTSKPSRPFKPLDSDEERSIPVGCFLSFACGIAAVVCILARIIYYYIP